jgi:hypothetical protein
MTLTFSGLSRSPWLHFLGGPILWSAHFLATYNWVEFACRAHLLVLDSTLLGFTILSWSVLGLTLSAMLAALYVGWLSYQSWRRIKGPQGPDERETWSLHSRGFMAFSGVFLSALFALVILFTGLPALVLEPCT